jgi:hypothetical protein
MKLAPGKRGRQSFSLTFESGKLGACLSLVRNVMVGPASVATTFEGLPPKSPITPLTYSVHRNLNKRATTGMGAAEWAAFMTLEALTAERAETGTGQQ